MTYAGEQDLKCSENYSFAAFMHLKLRRQQGIFNGGGKKQGGDWITGFLTTLCALLRVS